MFIVTFKYKGIPTVIDCKKDETLEEICSRFCKKFNAHTEDFVFTYENQEVNLNLTFFDHANQRDRKIRTMNVYVAKR